jgi:glucose/arabinose dehydrogenase
MQVGGIAVFKNEVYFSRQFRPSARDNGVFRLSGNQLTAVAGGPGSPATLSPAGDGGPANAASLDTPAGIAFNGAGDLFIAETGAGRVRRVSGGVISTYAGRGPCGVMDPPSPGSALQTLLCGPELVAANTTGDLYVTRRGWTWIARVFPSGALSPYVGFQAAGLAIDTNGALLATDGTTGRIVRFDVTGTPTTIADGLGLVTALAVGPDGSIYVINSTAPSGSTLLKITKLRPL